MRYNIDGIWTEGCESIVGGGMIREVKGGRDEGKTSPKKIGKHARVIKDRFRGVLR